MKRFAAAIFVLGALLVALPGTASLASPPFDPPLPPDCLTSDQLAGAIIVYDINARQHQLRPGEDALYCLKGSELCVLVTSDTVSGRAGLQRSLDAVWSITQVCGLDVYWSGVLAGYLRNRANITYYTDYARAPARFNWMDMSGTKSILLGTKWENLSQYSSPGLGVKFTTSGYVQAGGNFVRCVAGLCRSDYFVSRLRVNTSRTYCQ